MKGDKHDGKNDEAMGGGAGPQPTTVSGSGAIEAERAIGRAEADASGRDPPEVCSVAPEPERFDIGSPARGEGLEVELHEAPSTTQG